MKNLEELKKWKESRQEELFELLLQAGFISCKQDVNREQFLKEAEEAWEIFNVDDHS